ncbi:MAG: hypothetical protein MJZ38_06900, partial [archaeon]|nr:hypothetical protein [archaeon]
MRSHTTSGLIVLRDSLGIEYRVCRLDYTMWEDGSYEYVFIPEYDMLELLPKEFQGVPGIDLDLHRERYVRRDMEPVYVTERSPSGNRQDLWDLLEEAGMDHLNRLEWMIRTGKGYHGDRFFTVRYSEREGPLVIDGPVTESARLCGQILSALGAGRAVILDGREVTGPERAVLCSVLRSVLSSDRRYRAGRRSEDGVTLASR